MSIDGDPYYEKGEEEEDEKGEEEENGEIGDRPSVGEAMDDEKDCDFVFRIIVSVRLEIELS